MITFLKNSILGTVIIGAVGSIVGYLLILIYQKLKGSVLVLKKNMKDRKFEKFKRKYINDHIEARVLLDDKMPNGIILTKIIIDFCLNMGVIIISWVVFIQLLLLSINSTSVVIKFFSFITGFIGAFPSYNLGYIHGGFKIFYQPFIDRNAKELDIKDLENQAFKKFNPTK
jgi:hypothetical protein